MPQADFSRKMNDEVARYLKEGAEVARSDKQNTTEMDLDLVYSTTRNAFNKENIFFSKPGMNYHHSVTLN